MSIGPEQDAQEAVPSEDVSGTGPLHELSETTSLEQVAEVAEELAAEQREVAERARALQRERHKGASWATILQHEERPGLLGLLAGSARRLAEVTAGLRHTMIEGLASEGISTRKIAGLLGVSHQRISTLRNRSRSQKP